MPKRKQSQEIPPADAFRAWLLAALEATGTKPATVSRAIGASVNSVGAFLRDPARDITLSRAAEIERYLRRHAQERGTTLPAIRRRVTIPAAA